jgi:hypothetical protein
MGEFYLLFPLCGLRRNICHHSAVGFDNVFNNWKKVSSLCKPLKDHSVILLW